MGNMFLFNRILMMWIIILSHYRNYLLSVLVHSSQTHLIRSINSRFIHTSIETLSDESIFDIPIKFAWSLASLADTGKVETLLECHIPHFDWTVYSIHFATCLLAIAYLLLLIECGILLTALSFNTQPTFLMELIEVEQSF